MKQADLMVARAICIKLQVADRKLGVELISHALAQVRSDERQHAARVAHDWMMDLGDQPSAEAIEAELRQG